jgi:excinuclease ABC subunit C
MTSQAIKKQIAKLPDAPGVYFFRRGKGSKSEILYIGKATSLRDRVRSYFASDIGETRGPLISKMLADFDDIKFQQTDSVLEALILEAHLIKKFQPPANTMEKDDRSWNFVIITDEKFPRVLTVRGRELLKNGQSFSVLHKFGPFPNGGQLKEALKIVRRLFPYRDACVPAEEQIKKNGSGKIRACFNRQLGLCPGVCTGEISAKEYGKTIKNITLFFESKKKELLKNLQKEMKRLSGERKFEEAGKIKRQIFALGHIQDVSLIKNGNVERPVAGEKFRIESYDVAHMSGQNVVGVMTVVENGEPKKSDYRKFRIRDNPGVNDTKALSEILTRRLAHIEWPAADLIVVDGGVAQKNAAEKVLRENRLDTPVVSVVKDEHHRPKQILGDKKWLSRESEILLGNAESHRFAISFHKKLRNKLPN